MIRAAVVLFLFSFALPVMAQASCAPEEVLVAHSLGETCVPAGVERVVALEWTYAEDLLALGLQPVGVADIGGYKSWVKLPVELAPDVADVGTRQEPSLERIAELKPDLIVAVAFRVGESYEQLNAIAPTLVFDPYSGEEGLSQFQEMRDTLGAIARAVGREAEAKAVLGRLDRTFAETAAKLEQAAVATPFMLAQAYSGGEGVAEIRMFTVTSFASQIIERLGLENAWPGSDNVYGFDTIGIEGLQSVRDVSFFYVVNATDDVFASGNAAPLWQSLPFVRSGQAYPLGGDTWLFGGPLSAERLIKDVSAALLGGEE